MGRLADLEVALASPAEAEAALGQKAVVVKEMVSLEVRVASRAATVARGQRLTESLVYIVAEFRGALRPPSIGHLGSAGTCHYARDRSIRNRRLPVDHACTEVD